MSTLSWNNTKCVKHFSKSFIPQQIAPAIDLNTSSTGYKT